MQAAGVSSTAPLHNARLPHDEGGEELYDKLDKLAESSSQAAARRLSGGHVDQARRTSISNGNDKGKNKMEDDDHEVEMEVKADSDDESIYDSDDESLHCAICLSVIDDRTVVQPCCHDAYCFVCILAWTEQSRRCPLCVANIDLLVHNIRSEKDYQKHYLPPLLKSDSPPPERSFRELREGARRQLFNRPTHPRFKYAEWKARNKPAPMPDVDAEDLALEKRRYVYKYGLYVKHVASNRFTRFRDYSAQQVSSTPELKQRLQKWLRRELRVFDGVDLAFLVDYCTNIASQLELRSDSATRLMADFIGEDQAEHFWHETYSFLRSPFKDVRLYDKAVQYDRPPCKVQDAALESRELSARPSRRVRSRSMSSVSEAGSFTHKLAGRRGSTNNRRGSQHKGRLSPSHRREGDSYIPSYSILNKADRPPRKRANRRPSQDRSRRSAGNARNHQEQPTSKSDPQQGRAEARPTANLSETTRKDESDVEDVISLGESDYESAPLVPHRGEPVPHRSDQAHRVRQAALSIRGLAQSKPLVKENGKEIDVIRDLAPDLLSRLSGPRGDNTSGNPSASDTQSPSLDPISGSAEGIQMKGRGFRKGRVNSEMHATLMARLSEEKMRSETIPSPAAIVANGHQSTEKTEASLREHVLHVLKERREQAMRSNTSELATEHFQSIGASASAPVQADSKTARLAILQSRLAAERAAISPPIPAEQPAQPGSQGPSGGTTRPAASSTASDASVRMAELKRRLAEQKAARLKA